MEQTATAIGCSEATVGMHKCVSAAATIRSLNSSVSVELYKEGFTPANAVDMVERYDVVVDASDNAPTRYLIRHVEHGMRLVLQQDTTPD